MYVKLKDNEQLKGKVAPSTTGERSIYDDLLDAQKDPNIVHVHVCANLQGDYAVKVLRNDASGGFYHSGADGDEESKAWREYAENYGFKNPGEEYIYTPAAAGSDGETGALNLGCTARTEMPDGSQGGLPRLDVPGKYGEIIFE